MLYPKNLNEAYFDFATDVRPPAVSRSLAKGSALDHPRRVIGAILVRLGRAITPEWRAAALG